MKVLRGTISLFAIAAVLVGGSLLIFKLADVHANRQIVVTKEVAIQPVQPRNLDRAESGPPAGIKKPPTTADIKAAKLPWQGAALEVPGATKPTKSNTASFGVFAERASLTPSNGRVANEKLHIAKASLTTQQAIKERQEAREAAQPELPKFVMSICLDLQGNLWVGSEGDGIFRLDVSTQRWTKFTEKDGLGDDNGYAIACDRKGRIWVGHLNHGVSVFNGQKWQCYEVVGGLSRPDTLNGPLGERIFNIKCNPVDGDVWMASSCGLARYSEFQDTWSYYTREDGLPSDQANALAFDAEGNIYVGTQCNGLAIAKAKDDYRTWCQVTGPDEMPTTPTGFGLPTNLINDVLMTDDQTLFVATDCGVAISDDFGVNFRYFRGQDWADKVRGRFGGSPGGWIERPGACLSEDYVTSLCQGRQKGAVLVGFRRRGFSEYLVESSGVGCIDVSPFHVSSSSIPTSRMTKSALGVYAVYSTGKASIVETKPRDLKGSSLTQPLISVHPKSAVPITVEDLMSSFRVATVARLDKREQILFIGDDWATQGNWMGRYGRQYALLCGANSPRDTTVALGRLDYHIEGRIGRQARPNDSMRYWLHWLERNTDSRVLWNPAFGCRRQAEWDDHGETYPRTVEGPGILVRTRIPSGLHLISLYLVNKDSHLGVNSQRDYVITGFAASPSEKLSRSIVARVTEFTGGVFKSFVVVGPGDFSFQIARNGSINTIVSGVFLDRIEDDSVTGRTDLDDMPLAFMGNLQYVPPRTLLKSLPSSFDNYSDTIYQHLYEHPGFCRQLYRALSTAEMDASGLATLRWKFRLWAQEDRVSFASIAKEAWVRQQRMNRPKTVLD